MTAAGTIPAWLPRQMPDVRDWREVGPNRYRGVTDPRWGTEPEHVLVAHNPADGRFRSIRIAESTVRDSLIDIVEWMFGNLEDELKTSAEVAQ